MEYAQYFEDVVHEPTQREGAGFDLTVAEVYEITAPGRADFGGGELEPAETAPHPTRLRDPEDDYEWWHLEAGTYLLEYNESIAADAVVTLQTRTEIVERGAFHPTLSVPQLPRMALSVGGGGLRLKENARVSTVVDAERC